MIDSDAAFHPDDSARERIDALIATMLVDPSPEYPVTRNGYVRTFLYPCDFYELPADRMAALRTYAIATESTAYFAKALSQTPWAYVPPQSAAHAEIVPPPGE